MPTGRCAFPEHHGPSAGPPAGLVLAILAGAFAVLHWHTMLEILIVAAVLLLLGAAVMLLLHNHRSGYDEALERQAELERIQRQAIAQRQQAQRPAVHNHIHLHGVDAATVPPQSIRVAIPRPYRRQRCRSLTQPLPATPRRTRCSISSSP